ncbi:MAG: hypothetical protein K2X46_14185 [Roseomonas sp.]|nr:hypothetical protein [Roseomonas sp.]
MAKRPAKPTKPPAADTMLAVLKAFEAGEPWRCTAAEARVAREHMERLMNEGAHGLGDRGA